MKKNQFTNFDYEIITSSSTGKKEVKVSYQFNNKQCRKYLLVDESKKLKDSEYIEIAKEQIKESIKNGQLAKYSKQFTFSVHFGVVPTVIASIAGVAAITCASLFAWKAITGGGTGGGGGDTVVVDFLNEDGSLFERKKVTKGDTVTKPENSPTTEDNGCFANWYVDSDFATKYDFDNKVTTDLTLYPKFSKRLLLMDYHYEEAVAGGFSNPELEIEISANQNEEIFVDWGDGGEPIQITNFDEHITHKYASGLEDYLEIMVYGNAESVSLSYVDATDLWKTHLFKDDNAFMQSVFLFKDMNDASESSCFGGLMQDGTTPSKLSAIGAMPGVTHIPNHFAACASVANHSLIDRGMFANSVTDIGNYAFANNSSLTRIMFKDTIKHIGESAFYNCHNVNYIRFGRNLESIGNNAFGNLASSVSILAEALYYRWHLTGTIPAFGEHEGFGNAANFYVNPISADEFCQRFRQQDWPIGGNYPSVLPLMYESDPASSHQFIISNVRYPLLTTSPFTEGNYGFIADIECVDSPTFVISENTVNCGCREPAANIEWISSRISDHFSIGIRSNELRYAEVVDLQISAK